MSTTKKQMNSKRIISRCPNCNIILFHSGETCPLCHCVTQETEKEETDHIIDLFGDDAPYPDVEGRLRKLRLALRVILLIFVVAELLMILINKVTTVSYPWSFITGVALLYIYLSLKYWVDHDSGFASKVGLQIMITICLLFAIDSCTGMRGWALQWAIPGVLLLGDLVVALLMIINRSRWQSYILLLLLTGIISLFLIILYFAGRIESVVMPLICEVVTCLYLFVLILFGGRKAEHEFSRRFHI